jgi:hypothetical protein
VWWDGDGYGVADDLSECECDDLESDASCVKTLCKVKAW